MNIKDILELLQDIATNAKNAMTYPREYALHAGEETEEEYATALATEHNLLGIAHDCSRAVALHNGGYYRQFTKSAIAVLKRTGAYSQDIHNFLAMWDAQNNY
jgi:hypothetical protein